MTERETKKKRIRESDRERLKDLKEHPAVVEVVDKEQSQINYTDVLNVVLPEKDEDGTLSRPEDEMVFIQLLLDEGVVERIEEFAGENVSTHEVIHHYINQFEATNDL